VVTAIWKRPQGVPFCNAGFPTGVSMASTRRLESRRYEMLEFEPARLADWKVGVTATQ
jgi:hypothetical protein